VSWDLLEFALIAAQFVAMKLGYGYTIEEQLSATTVGGIQIDVFPSLVGVAKFHHSQHLELDLEKSPQDLNIKPKEQITMTST
jgi:hypothetical protein